MTKNEYLWKRANRLRAASYFAHFGRHQRKRARRAAGVGDIRTSEIYLRNAEAADKWLAAAVKAVLDLDAMHPDLFAQYVWIGRPTRAEARATAA